MKYLMKRDRLSNENETVLAKIRKSLNTSSCLILAADGNLMLNSVIEVVGNDRYKPGDVRNRRYLLVDSRKEIVATALPDYDIDDNPDDKGWPISHLPRADNAVVQINKRSYSLKRNSFSRYELIDGSKPALILEHRGISGGWNIESDIDFPPEIICGIYIFCRYLEKENIFPLI